MTVIYQSSVSLNLLTHMLINNCVTYTFSIHFYIITLYNLKKNYSIISNFHSEMPDIFFILHIFFQHL